MIPRLLNKLSPPYPTFACFQQQLCENGSVNIEDCFHDLVSKWMTSKKRIQGLFDSRSLRGKHNSLTAPSLSDVWIVLMGVTGSGKSSFILQVVEGVATTVDTSLESCASHSSSSHFTLFFDRVLGAVESKCYSFKHHSGRVIHLIDTPGSFCSKLRTREMFSDLFASLTRAYGQSCKLNGIIYLHRITDPHLGGPGLDYTNCFKRICGEGAFKNIVLATTMWTDQHGRLNVPHDVAVQRENLLTESDRSWGIMNDMGSRVVRHTPDKDSAMDILEGLMSLPPLTFTFEGERKE